jgi:4-amino-4-deoxy-L-arabinose transferase-like glycosyltransferase
VIAPREARRRANWGEVLAWAAIVALAAGVQAWQWLPAQQPGWKYDEGVNVIKADLTLQGYRLYSDIWSDQPPLFTWLLAATFRLLGHEVWAGRMLVAAMAAVGALALGALARRLAGRLPAVLAVALLATLPHYQTLGRQLLIGLPALALALLALAVLVAADGRRRGEAWVALAGLIFGASRLVKPLTAPMALPLGIWAVLAPDWPKVPRRRLRRVAIVVVAAALPVTLALLYCGPQALIGQIVGTLFDARASQGDYTLWSNLREIGVYLVADRWGLGYWGLPALAAGGSRPCRPSAAGVTCWRWQPGSRAVLAAWHCTRRCAATS